MKTDSSFPVAWLLKDFILCLFMCTSICFNVFAQVSSEARRGCQMLLNKSYRELLATQFERWELNLGPLAEQQVLLSAKLSL